MPNEELHAAISQAVKQAAAPFDITKRQTFPAAPGATPPTVFKPPTLPGSNAIDAIGKTHNAWQRWLDQNYTSPQGGFGAGRAGVHSALSNQLQTAGPNATQQFNTHLQQTVYPKAQAPHQTYQFTPKPDLPSALSGVNEFETEWKRQHGREHALKWLGRDNAPPPPPLTEPPPPPELTLGMQQGPPKAPYDRLLPKNWTRFTTDNNETTLAHELEHVNQDLPRAGEPDSAATMFESAGQKLSPYDKGVLADVDYKNNGNAFRETMFQTQTEPGAVFTELAHAADATQAATGQKPQGEMQLVPDGPAGGYSLPTEDILREARRSGVLSGKRTATDMLNTPAGQAWMRMQYGKLNTNQPPVDDRYKQELDYVTEKLQSQWPEKEDIHNQHYDYMRGRQQEYWNELPPEMQQDVLKNQPGILMPQQLEKMPFERKPWHITPAIPQNNWNEKTSELKPEIILQPHQQRVADRVSGPDPRMLVYHGLGTGKSLAAIAAAEAAKKNSGGDYAIVAPASLRDNFKKEIDKFTTGSNPDILSYTGLGLGQTPKNNPETLIFDEAHRLRNPEGLAAQAASEAAKKVPRVVLLTGSPITNEPSDLANLMSILRNENITPENFEDKYVQYKKVKPGWGGWLRGVKPGEEADVKNPEELKSKLRGHVDYNPGKSPEGVNINQQIIDAPMTAEQERIQKAIRTKIPPRFLWKLDKEFPLSREELGKLNSFLTGMRQISLSTQPFRADKNYLKAFDQSGKLQTALTKLRETLDSDPRKKALIYSNYIDAGLQPYAAALAKNNIPHAIFHGGVPLAERRKALDEYNAGKLRALLIGPAGAEGISTKGTSLIQLLDPHWNETRSQQAQGRGLRFDSHMDLPEELKNVAVQRFISRAKEPGWFKKHILGAQKIRTGDEILDTLAKEKEKANEKFRAILKQVGSESPQEEVARRMYEEHVPEEQRKAAASAWAKMT